MAGDTSRILPGVSQVRPVRSLDLTQGPVGWSLSWTNQRKTTRHGVRFTSRCMRGSESRG